MSPLHDILYHPSTVVSQLLQEAVVVPPFIKPRFCPLQLLFVFRTEKSLAGNKYETSAALISAVNQYLSSRSTSWFAEGIQMLPQRWQKYIDLVGDNFEKEQKEFLKNISLILRKSKKSGPSCSKRC